MSLSNLLAQTAVFSLLDEDEMKTLTASAVQRAYIGGEWVTHQGDIWPHLFYLKKGAVTAIKESLEGRSLILETIRKGEIFWGLAFFLENAPMPAALKAQDDTEMVLWSRQSLLPLLLQNGRLSWELSCLTINRIRRASAIVDELAFQPVAGRLAGFLLDRYHDAVGDYVLRDLTLEEMAAHIGSTREMVCRLLYRFSEAGAIQITRTEVMIADQQVLAEYARKEK
jgi:CRP-like cAMP-binding protein